MPRLLLLQSEQEGVAALSNLMGTLAAKSVSRRENAAEQLAMVEVERLSAAASKLVQGTHHHSARVLRAGFEELEKRAEDIRMTQEKVKAGRLKVLQRLAIDAKELEGLMAALNDVGCK